MLLPGLVFVFVYIRPGRMIPRLGVGQKTESSYLLASHCRPASQSKYPFFNHQDPQSQKFEVEETPWPPWGDLGFLEFLEN